MNQKEDADMNAAATLHPSSDGLFGRVLGWFNDRSAKAAQRRDAAKWVKSLGRPKVVELMKTVELPEHLFADDFGNNQAEDQLATRLYFEAAVGMFPNEAVERQVALGAAMHYERFREWNIATASVCIGEGVARENARREAYRADYDARLNAAAAADATTPANRKAYAEQAYRNTGKYLTNTGRELTQDERYQLGLPSVREQKSGLLDAR